MGIYMYVVPWNRMMLETELFIASFCIYFILHAGIFSLPVV